MEQGSVGFLMVKGETSVYTHKMCSFSSLLPCLISLLKKINLSVIYSPQFIRGFLYVFSIYYEYLY